MGKTLNYVLSEKLRIKLRTVCRVRDRPYFSI